jgi:hypothetical protein
VPSIIYDDFKGGLDLRKAASMGGANIQYVLRNFYTATGKSLKKRPCLNRISTLESGTAGLKAAGGKLNTFYNANVTGAFITHADPRFVARNVPHPATAQPVTKAHYGELFNGYLYAAVEYANGDIRHHYLDGTPNPIITDVNCPHSKQVKKIGQKIYAASGANVRYTKTADPRDWTAVSDAGSIPSGIHAAGSDTVTALGEFQKDLAIAYSDSMQIWGIDADPANNALKSTASNIGTMHSKTMATLASDLIFLAKQGFRSVSVVNLTDNLQENDVGSAIDALRSEILDTDDPQSIYYPTLGQLWEINGARAYVYSFARSVKMAAWAVFDFPIEFEDAAVLNGALYVRSGNIVYEVSDTVFADDGMVPLCEVEMFYQDAKTPGILKQFMGFDGVVKGSPEIAFKFNANEPEDVTDYLPIEGDMRPGELYPMEVCATAVAPILRHQRNEACEISLLQLYYENLGPM